MKQLGQKIRELRQAKHMTLADLAGDQMTKGMLSLIENGKNNPSMESLEYIALKLQVTTSELLDEGNSEITDRVYEQVLAIQKRSSFKAFKEIIELVRPHLNQFSNNYKTAIILRSYAFANSAYKENLIADYYFNKSRDILLKGSYINELIELERLNLVHLLRQNKYNDTLEKALSIFETYENNPLIQNPNLIPNILTIIASTSHELHEYENGIYYANLAKEISIDNKTFSPLPNIIKELCWIYMITNNQLMYDKTYKELDNLSIFLNHDFDFKFCCFTIHLSKLFMDEKNEELLSLLDHSLEFFSETNIELSEYLILNNSFLSLIRGITLYRLEKFEEGINILKNLSQGVIFPSPIDRSLFALKYAYLALNEQRIGHIQQAIALSAQALAEIEGISSNPFTHFIIETYEQLIELKN